MSWSKAGGPAGCAITQAHWGGVSWGWLGNEGHRGYRARAVHWQGRQPQRRPVRLCSPCGPNGAGIGEGLGAGSGAPTLQ